MDVLRMRRDISGDVNSPMTRPDIVAPRRSAAYGHAHENSVLAHKVMMECSRDVHGRNDRDSNAKPTVDHEQLPRQLTVLWPDQRQVEETEKRHRRRIGRGRDQADHRV